MLPRHIPAQLEVLLKVQVLPTEEIKRVLNRVAMLVLLKIAIT